MAWRQRLAGRTRDRQLEPGQRQPDAAGQPRPVVWVGDVESALGRPVALERLLAGERGNPLGEHRRQRRRARHEQPQRAKVRPCRSLLTPSAASRSRGPRTAPWPGPPRAHRTGPGFEARADHRARTRQERRVQPTESVLVKQRQRMDEHVVGVPAPREHRGANRATRFASLSGTAFGLPVVPDV